MRKYQDFFSVTPAQLSIKEKQNKISKKKELWEVFVNPPGY
jgi:hypothetical protein